MAVPTYPGDPEWIKHASWVTRAVELVQGACSHDVRTGMYVHAQVSLAPGKLPLAFEGEERSTAGLGDVMQVLPRPEPACGSVHAVSGLVHSI